MSVHPLGAAAVAAGVSDLRVLEAVAAVPRSDFVPGDDAAQANLDRPLRIPHAQVTTQPSLVARMVEALALSGSERVLEIGTGYGWQRALLGRLAADVWSVERFPDLARTARSYLARHGTSNAHVVTGDGTEGLPEHAPYEAIIVCAAFPAVPAPLAEQLADGGRLVQPIGRSGDEDVVLFTKRNGVLERVRSVMRAHFVPLAGRHGFHR